MDNAIEINKISKRWKGFQLDNISFTIPRGYICGLIGPNGAGKTTIIKLIMNLIRYDTGFIKVFGLDSRTHEAEIKSRIGFVYDQPCFCEDVSLKTIARSTAPLYKNWDQGKYEEYVKLFELPEKKRYSKLSKGMKMKFFIALALSHDADLLIMDEPTSGLDPVFRREFLGILSEILQDENKTVLFSSHITSDLERIADYVVFINNGKIVFDDSKDDILSKWGIVKGPLEELNEGNKKLLKGYKENKYGFEGITSDFEQARKVFNSGSVVEKTTLEDIMYFLKRED